MNFRLRDYVLHPLAIKQLHDLLRTAERWSAERRRGWVQERLERVLCHAVSRVPYYRRTLTPFRQQFPQMIDRLDLSELPFITKQTVREHFAELAAEPLPRLGTAVVHTSGTTGTPTEFLVDADSQRAQFASLWRVLNWVGYRFGDRFVEIKRNPTRGPLARRAWQLNCLILPVYNFQKDNVPLYLERIRRFDPVLIKTYPCAIDLLCRWMRELDLVGYRPRAVLSCAETLLDHQRATIDEVLGCPLFDFYNHNERAGLISTCERGTYHVHEEYSHLELVDEKGGRADSDAAGEVVATTLHNFAMPLIRYRTGDLCTAGPEEPCACGRSYRRVERIHGRITDVVVTPDGRHLSGLEHAFMRSPGVRLSQIVQDEVDEIRVNLVKAASYTPGDLGRIESGLRSFLGDAMRIQFEFVETIEPCRNGKVQFVVSKPGRLAAHQEPAGRA